MQIGDRPWAHASAIAACGLPNEWGSPPGKADNNHNHGKKPCRAHAGLAQSPLRDRASNFPYFSRVVRFDIDEKAMTVAQNWTYQPMYGNTALYSAAMSDADWQPNGNVLVASGTLSSARPVPGWAQIVEVTSDGETVFELNVIDSPTAYTTFDADRIPDLRTMTWAD